MQQIDNKKMWELLAKFAPNRESLLWVNKCIEYQGYKLNDNFEIVSIEPEYFEIEKGKWYMCINNQSSYGVISYTQGKLYQCKIDNYLPNDCGGECMWTSDALLYFRPATPEEIPQEPKQENTLKGTVEARKEIITCAEDFQKQKPSDGELTEFEKEIAHVLVYKCYDGNLETEEEIHNAYRQYYDDAKLFAPMLLAKARKQIASEINIDEMVQKFKDGVKENPYGILACLTLHGAYRLDMNDTLKAIKGE